MNLGNFVFSLTSFLHINTGDIHCIETCGQQRILWAETTAATTMVMTTILRTGNYLR